MKFLADHQKEAIELFLKLSRNFKSVEARNYVQKCKSVSSDLIQKKYQIRPLHSSSQRLTPSKNTLNAFSEIKTHKASFQLGLSLDQVMSFHEMQESQRKQLLKRKLFDFSQEIQFKIQNNEDLPKLQNLSLNIINGKPIENVTDTMFVAPLFLYKMGLVVENEYKQLLLTISGLNVCCEIDPTNKLSFEFCENYGTSEKRFLYKIFKDFFSKKPNKITFKHFYFITHFSVSVLAFLMFFYEDCKIDNLGNVILNEFIDENSYSRQFNEIKSFFENLENLNSVFTLMFPPKIQRTPFARKLMEFNSNLLFLHLNKFVNKI